MLRFYITLEALPVSLTHAKISNKKNLVEDPGRNVSYMKPFETELLINDKSDVSSEKEPTF